MRPLILLAALSLATAAHAGEVKAPTPAELQAKVAEQAEQIARLTDALADVQQQRDGSAQQAANCVINGDVVAKSIARAAKK